MAITTEGTASRSGPATATAGPALWWRETSGAVADLGVLVPIAVALIVANGLSPTAVLLPAALLYLIAARVYRLPVAVQPLKAFGAVAIAAGVGSDVIASGALLMGVIFVALGLGDWLNRVARWFPMAVVRGVQLSVGLLFAKVAWGLVMTPQVSFDSQLAQPWLPIAALALFGLLLWQRRRVVLVVILAALATAVVLLALSPTAATALGPSAIQLPVLSVDSFATAFVLLVLPQLPLTLANSCIAPADAARTYFGPTGDRVTPGRLARTLGLANVFAGAISGMPVCHGAGGLSAHYAFGARTWRAPLIMGSALLVAAIGFGSMLGDVLPLFPLSVLAALLGVAAVVHIGLLRDVRGVVDWTVTIVVGLVGAWANLGIGVLLGLAMIGVVSIIRRGQSPVTRPGPPDQEVDA